MISLNLIVLIPALMCFFALFFNNKTSNWFFWLSILFAVLFSFLRYDLGGDYVAYYKLYQYPAFYSIDIFLKDYSSTDIGFDVLVYISSSLGLGFNLFLALITLSQLLILNCVLKKFPENNKFAVFMFFFIFFGSYFLNLVVLRQGLSAAFFFLAVFFVTEKKYFLSIISYLLGCLFHKGLLFFFPFLFFGFFPVYRYFYIFLAALTFLVILIPVNQYSIVLEIFGLESFSSYLDKEGEYNSGVTGIVRVFVLLIVIFFGFFLKSSFEKRVYIFVVAYFCFSIFGMKIPYADRLSCYFSFFVPVCLGFIYCRMKPGSKFLLILLILLSFNFSLLLRQSSYFYNEYKVFFNKDDLLMDELSVEKYRLLKNTN